MAIEIGYIYIMGSDRPTLYIGVTSNLKQRIWEHKHDIYKGFTARYGVHKLLYYEEYSNITDAILREKQLKRWHRAWKLNLIRSLNPNFKDLDAETSSA